MIVFLRGPAKGLTERAQREANGGEIKYAGLGRVAMRGRTLCVAVAMARTSKGEGMAAAIPSPKRVSASERTTGSAG